MLSYFLAIAIATISIGLYVTAFLSPKIHRQDDFLWSGLGLFYALILWICAGRITGALLLGQLAATSLIVTFIWETRQLRKVITSQEIEVKLEGVSILNLILGLVAKLSKSQPSTPETNVVSETQEIITPEESSVTPNQDDSVTANQQQLEDIGEEKTTVELQKQPETLEEKPPLTPTEITPEESINNSAVVSEEENGVESNIESSSEVDSPVESVDRNKTSTTESKSFVNKLINLFKQPFSSKSSDTSSEITQPKEKQEEDNEIVNSETSLDNSSLEADNDLETDTNTNDSIEIQNETEAEFNLDLDIDEKSDTLNSDSSETELDVNVELEELDIESSSASETIDSSEEINLEEYFDDFESQTKEQKETSDENLNVDEVPEEDKISMLTDLIDEDELLQDNKGKDVSEESNLDSEPKNESDSAQ